jgi:hypothetical protein
MFVGWSWSSHGNYRLLHLLFTHLNIEACKIWCNNRMTPQWLSWRGLSLTTGPCFSLCSSWPQHHHNIKLCKSLYRINDSERRFLWHRVGKYCCIVTARVIAWPNDCSASTFHCRKVSTERVQGQLPWRLSWYGLLTHVHDRHEAWVCKYTLIIEMGNVVPLLSYILGGVIKPNVTALDHEHNLNKVCKFSWLE